MVRSNLDDSGIHKEMPCTATALFKGLEGRIQLPSTLKIPAVHPLVLLPLFMVVHLSAGKGFAPLFPLGWGLGEHRHTQPFLVLSQVSSKQADSPTSQPGKSLGCCVAKATVCVLCLPLAKASVEIQRQAGSINTAV